MTWDTPPRGLGSEAGVPRESQHCALEWKWVQSQRKTPAASREGGAEPRAPPAASTGFQATPLSQVPESLDRMQ